MKLALSALAITFALASASTWAASSKEEEAIKYRKGVFAAMGWHFSPIGAMVKGERPFDAKLVMRNTARLEVLSQMPLEGFIPGTESGDTKVKPEAFLEMEKFRAGMEKMQKEVAKLATVAKSGNLDKIKPQFGETAKACKACHDNYRDK